MFNKVLPKVGQIVKQGGERYEAFNAGAADLKAGDAIELVSGDHGRIGVKKLDTGACIGFVVSDVIDFVLKQGDTLTYASTSSFIALNATELLAVKDKVKPAATGVAKATLPADAALVCGTVYGGAALNGIAIIKLSVE